MPAHLSQCLHVNLRPRVLHSGWIFLYISSSGPDTVEEELIKPWDGVVEGQRAYQDYCMEYKEDLFSDGECDIINDIERIQQALLGLSSIDTEAEFRQLFDEL